MSERGMSVEVRHNFDEVKERITALLKDEGFGILTEIDVRDTLRKKLEVEFRRYVILGACNPPFAHAALQVDLEVGLAMPCNVVLYENDRGHTVVLVVDPVKLIGGDERLLPIASEMRARIERILAKLA